MKWWIEKIQNVIVVELIFNNKVEMNRLNTLTKEIKESMKKHWFKKTDIQPKVDYDPLEWIDNVGTICWEVSWDITMEAIAWADQYRWQVTTYSKLKTAQGIKSWYLIILDCDLESCSSAKKLAKQIIEYEDEAKSLSIIIKQQWVQP